MGYKGTSEGGLTIKDTSFWVQRIRILSSRKVESYTDTNVIGWSVMKNTLESQQELLLRGSRNTRRLLPQYMTTTTHNYNTSGHSVTIDNFSIVGREDQKHHENYQRSLIHTGQQSIP